MIPQIRTERLVMRGWRAEDFDAFIPFWSDPRASAYIGGPVQSRGEGWRKMASYAGHWQLRGYGFWVLQTHDDPAPLGYCGLWYPDEWPEPEVGWAVLPAHQRLGIASEAARAAIRYAEALGWQTLISLINQDNTASRGVAEKLGATFEKEFRIRSATALIYRHHLHHQTQ